MNSDWINAEVRDGLAVSGVKKTHCLKNDTLIHKKYTSIYNGRCVCHKIFVGPQGPTAGTLACAGRRPAYKLVRVNSLKLRAI